MSGSGGGGMGGAIKNKQPAPLQITAEQIMREAFERQEAEYKPPKQVVRDEEELDEFRLEKRRQFEDGIRRNRDQAGNWLKYARFEEEQGELKRARNVFERALAVDYRKPAVWLKYAEMEMRARAVNRARNVWDRAVQLLPRVDQLWLKYVLMEEALANWAAARLVFERWMEWAPGPAAWAAYVRFESRHGEADRARALYARWAAADPAPRTYAKWALFEARRGDAEAARAVYAAGLEAQGELGAASAAAAAAADAADAEAEREHVRLLLAFARFETEQGEWERARAIYRYALDRVPKARAADLYATFVAFEKQHGDRAGIEEAILARRRFQYEQEVAAAPRNYDAWFDYARLEEEALHTLLRAGSAVAAAAAEAQAERVGEVYERAVAQVPPAAEKRYWRRYVYLWLQYAVFEELDRGRPARARAVYEAALAVVPHAAFSFSKLWVLFAHFELRQKELGRARKVLGTAIGRAPKAKVFLAYVDLESKLGNIDRVRAVYERWLQLQPHCCAAWVRYAELEQALQETERARALFALAVDQAQLDMPELVWKAYIDFEVEEEEVERARALYERLLERTQHVKVWVSFARFEEAAGEAARARTVLGRAYTALRGADAKEERLALAEAWVDFEEREGSDEQLQAARARLPRRVKRTRPLVAEDGSEAGLEEYYDYVFPDDEVAQPHLKILQLAHKWKQNKKRRLEGEQPAPGTGAGADEAFSAEGYQ